MNTDPLNSQTSPAARPFRQSIRFVLLIVIPLICSLVIGVVYLKGGRYIETDNSYVKATKIPLSTEISGTIRELQIRENQNVAAGQILFRLDPAAFQVALARAEANVAEVRTNLAALKASYQEKQAEISLAKTKYKFADKEQRRQADLLAKKVIPVSSYDDARQNTDLAAQQVTALEQDLKRISEMLGGDYTLPIDDHPSYRAALAGLDKARLDLERTEVRAPRSGIVTNIPSTGMYISAGNVAMILVVNDNFWIEANFTETDLTHIKTGQPATIHIDTYPDTTWQGVVDSMSPATGAEFSVIPAQNATGNWVKITQRIPVRIKLVDTVQGMPDLRTGLSAIVSVDTGYQRQLFGYSL